MAATLTIAALTGSGLALASSIHCAVMCGPLALAARVRSGGGAVGSYYLGRLVGYTSAGAIAGGVGQVLLTSAVARTTESVLSYALSAFMAFTGVSLLRSRSAPALLTLGGAPRRSRIGFVLARLADEPLLLGVASALLPCSVLFTALLAAASMGSLLAGAISMASFAVCSGIALVAVAQLSRLRARGNVGPRVVGAALLLGAALMVARPLFFSGAPDDTPSCPLHAAQAHGAQS